MPETSVLDCSITKNGLFTGTFLKSYKQLYLIIALINKLFLSWPSYLWFSLKQHLFLIFDATLLYCGQNWYRSWKDLLEISLAKLQLEHSQYSLNFDCQSTRSQMFFETGVLNNYAIFTGKHLCWSFFLIKLQVSSLHFYWKRDSNIGVFLWILQSF